MVFMVSYYNFDKGYKIHKTWILTQNTSRVQYVTEVPFLLWLCA